VTTPSDPIGIAGTPTASAVATAAFRLLRARWRAIGLVTVLFVTPAALLDVAVGHLLDGLLGDGVLRFLVAISGALATVSLVLLAGFLDKLVGAERHGHPTMSLTDVARSLHWGRLITADLLLAVATVALGVVTIVGGAVVFTAWCLAGPLITLEDLGVRAAFRRSAHLVRRHPGTTVAVVTGPLYTEHAVVHVVDHLLVHLPFVAGFLLRSAVGVVVIGFVALMEVCLAFDLSLLYPTPPAKPMPRPR
jgi:hypothetical protein